MADTMADPIPRSRTRVVAGLAVVLCCMAALLTVTAGPAAAASTLGPGQTLDVGSPW